MHYRAILTTAAHRHEADGPDDATAVRRVLADSVYMRTMDPARVSLSVFRVYDEDQTRLSADLAYTGSLLAYQIATS
jgi:hypothetical protein